jgi:predicted nucleic acid-binding protein
VIFDPPPRRRALGRILWPILIGSAVVVALIVSASGEETRAELEYLEEMQADLLEIAKAGDALSDVARRLRRIERTEFVTVIEGVRADLAVGLEFVSRDPPTASLLSVRAMYRQALVAWDKGVEGYGASVLAAADDPESTFVLDGMADSLAELRAGDHLYADLLVDMDRADVPNALTDMPEVVVAPGQGTLVGLSASYINGARAPSSGLALDVGLAISQIVSDPVWQLNPSDEVVVPFTESILFSVVVTNVGNIRSERETVELTMLGGPEQVSQMAEVAALDPDQQVTLVFEPIE